MNLRVPRIAGTASLALALGACGADRVARPPLTGFAALVGTWEAESYTVAVGSGGAIGLEVAQPVRVAVAADSTFEMTTRDPAGGPLRIEGAVRTVGDREATLAASVNGSEPGPLTLEYARTADTLALAVRDVPLVLDAGGVPQAATLAATLRPAPVEPEAP